MFAFLISFENHAKSKVTFGGIELDKCAKGPMHWHDITGKDNVMWEINVEGATLNGHELFQGRLMPALIDTGTSYMSAPRAVVRRISDILEKDYGFGPEYSNRVGNATHKCSAEAYAKLTSLKFSFDGIEYNLPKTDWLPRRDGKCVIQIMRQEGQLFLGINWFNTYYTAFDMEKKRIGFAESVYSNLTPEESKEFNAKVLVNLS